MTKRKGKDGRRGGAVVTVLLGLLMSWCCEDRHPWTFVRRMCCLEQQQTRLF